MDNGRVAVISDIHFPHQCDMAVDCALDVIKEEKPSRIYLNGDILDFYTLSSFDKNPERKETIQEEIDMGVDFLHRLRRVAPPDAEITYILGNHEDRLRRALWKESAFASLRALEFDELLSLKKLNIRSIPYSSYDKLHGVVIMHGKKCGVTAARGNMLGTAGSGVSGHTHRLSMVHQTTPHGQIFWAESGCLCELQPEYVNGCANWQHGMLLGRLIHGQLRFKLVQIYEGDAFY